MGHFTRFDPNSYDLNKSSKKGVLIIHGFSSSTYETLPLGKFLSDKGFRVLIPNLPGHGTTVEDCNSFTYNDWLDFLEEKLAEISIECDEIYVIGLSMGAVLSLHLATLFPVNKIITCATVLKFKNPFVIHFLIPILNRIVVKQKKIKKQKKKNMKKRYSGYDHYPLKALNEFRKLNNYMKKRLHLIRCPILYVHSQSDKLSITDNVNLILDNVSSATKEKLIVEHATHHLFYESKDRDLIFSTINSFLKK
jgi:carboxylesterase|tara:strand:+ start:3345 stop:4097 length:753 start_codon:yes stop_codon:yes gene_type:complete